MKILNYIFALLLILNCNLFSQDTAIVKYFPLKTGNKWVYDRVQYFSPGPGKDVTKVESSFISSGHIYYQFRNIMYLSNGTIYTNTTYILRIDSLSGNIYSFGTLTECLVDSLKSRIGDTAFSCMAWGPPEWFRCQDTNTYSVFGQNPRTKNFVMLNGFEASVDRRYGKNFGIVYRHSGAVQYHQFYYLKGCVLNGVLFGDTTLVGINQISTEIPESFFLSQNYPNPFNPTTKIKFDIPPLSFGEEPGLRPRRGVRLVIFDILGREISTLVNEQLSPGIYEVEWDGGNYTSGVYFYKLIVSDASAPLSIAFTETKKMVLIK